jgi:glyoxylase-like metal-dependent hydrolase (beta-lactamase superfamily II)
MAGVLVTDLGGGVHRITHPLPLALDHVHCYAVEGAAGWALIDTGLASGAGERWRAALAQLGDPRVSRIVLTHFHPDHVGGSATLAGLTGAEVLQGAIDREFARRMYVEPGYLQAVRRMLGLHGMPLGKIAENVEHEGELLAVPATAARLLHEGDAVALGDTEFTVLVLPGHADGHIVLHDPRSGRLFAGDTVLQRITPNVATWPDSEPDPLARYLSTLERIARLQPTRTYPGHHELIDDAAGRAREIMAHHDVRLDVHEQALRAGHATTYDVARYVWGDALRGHEWRFALGEAISHLVRLVRLGRAGEVAAGRWAPV